MLKRFLDRSIRVQLAILLFGLTSLSIVVVGFLGVRAIITSGSDAGTITAESMRERAEELLVQTVSATASKNSLSLVNIQQQTASAAESVKNILENPAHFTQSSWKFNTKVTQLPDGQWSNSADEAGSIFIPNTVSVTPAIKKEVEVTSYLDYIFPQILKNTPDAIALFYNSELVVARYYPNIGLATVTPPDTPITELEFYTVANPQNNPDKSAKWTSVYDDPAGNGLLISAIYPAYLTSGAFIGSTGMDVSLSSIAQRIEDYSPIEQSYAFLIDDQGRAIALPGQGYRDMLNREQKEKEFGPDLNGIKGDFGNVIEHMKVGKSAFQEVTAGEQKLYVAYAPVENTPFSLGIVAKQDVVLSVVDDLRTQVERTSSTVLYYQILPTATIILLVVWSLGFLYIRYITRPLLSLTEKTEKVMLGDFSQHVNVESATEIGKLANAFNKMSNQLSASYQALEQKVKDRTQELDQKVLELEGAKAKDDAILSTMGEGVVLTDEKGTILVANPGAAELLSINLQDYVGKKLTEYPITTEKGETIPADQHPVEIAAKTGKQAHLDAQVPNITGVGTEAKVSLSIIATPVLQHSKTVGVVLIVRDVTKERQVDRMKTEFISIASHQLRTPLSSIKWFVEMLLNGDAGGLNTEQKEFAHNISGATARMIQLVNSLLNIARIESGRIIIDPQPTDVKELVEGVITDLKAKASERKQELSVKVDKELPKINLDPRLVSQVYLNLLSNAIKYTQPGGAISVTVSQKDGMMVSQVKDNGYGIPKSQHDKIFQKFFRADNAVKVEADGTGLGLYLIKAIVESSGGKIWFESEEKKGTTFWFTIPLRGMKAQAGEVTIDN